ncbi:BCCT family transporter [Cetobacterium sp. SF1]|uniref:BCCT family transporter n=1 Tax=Cetobacterium sp. SF1 TaxID=3417654 RepID=UPI003CF32C16
MLKKKDNTLFYTSLGLTLIFAIWGLIDPKSLTTNLWAWVYDFHKTFNWFTIFLPLSFLIILLGIAFSKYGEVKLGPKNSKPEFSTFSWIAMLFTAGIGVGLVNFGVAEPVVHYLYSPKGLAGGYNNIEAGKQALSLALYNWGIPAWSIYAMSGLVVGYFSYHRNTNYLPGSPIEEGFSDKKWSKKVGLFTNILATSAAALTVAASIGLGVFQVKNAVEAITGLSLSGSGMAIGILLVLFVGYTLPAILPLGKGMKFLGDFNIIVALGILLFTFILGPTRFFMEMILSTLGRTLTDLITVGTSTYIFQEKAWFNDWTLTTMIWWISWTPFTGVFIARISKGRTLREFILGTIGIPTFFLVIWFSVFGGYGILNDILGNKAISSYIINNPNDVYLSFIMVLQSLPIFKITGVLFVILIFVFLSTSATSSAIALSMMSNNGSENAPKTRTIIWCIVMGIIASANVLTGTLNGVRAIAVFLGLPYLFFLILQISAFIRAIRHDVNSRRV